MANNTPISWADSTVNFWHGCLPVSAGCKYCYMFRDKTRYGQNPLEVIRASKAKFYEALKWTEPRLIFTCSWSDFFISDADEKKDDQGNFISHWRKDAWEVIKKTPQHTWIILTKRPERIKQCLPPDWGTGYDNVWLGVSIEKQKQVKFRIMELFKIKCKVRFLSLEPMLEPINIASFLHVKLGPNEWVYPIHWVIVGGESGNDVGKYKYRPCRVEWLHDVVKQCQAVDVPVHVKQLGTSIAKQLELKNRHGDDLTEKNYPIYLKVRQFPKIMEI